MTTTVDAIYENGRIVLPRPLSLPENAPVRVTIEAGEHQTRGMAEALRRIFVEDLGQSWRRRFQ